MTYKAAERPVRLPVKSLDYRMMFQGVHFGESDASYSGGTDDYSLDSAYSDYSWTDDASSDSWMDDFSLDVDYGDDSYFSSDNSGSSGDYSLGYTDVMLGGTDLSSMTYDEGSDYISDQANAVSSMDQITAVGKALLSVAGAVVNPTPAQIIAAGVNAVKAYGTLTAATEAVTTYGDDPNASYNGITAIDAISGSDYDYSSSGGDYSSLSSYLETQGSDILTETDIQGVVEDETASALDVLRSATYSGIEGEQTALADSVASLGQYGGTEAFSEEAALLGAYGDEAQATAISAIPVSEATLAAESDAQQETLRSAAASGRLGGGATIDELITQSGEQQASRISDRLSSLSSLSDIEQSTASTISGLEETSAQRIAQLLNNLGVQESSAILGQVSTVNEATTDEATLEGLYGISDADEIAALLSQGTEAFATYTPTIADYFSSSDSTDLTSAGQGL